MSTILSQFALVFIVNTQPVLHIQLIDHFPELETCQKVVATIAQQETKEPESERIAPFLKCIKMSMRYNPDGDGPTKPVVPPAPNMPMMSGENDVVFSCLNQKGKSVVCRNTGYTKE